MPTDSPAAKREIFTVYTKIGSEFKQTKRREGAWLHIEMLTLQTQNMSICVLSTQTNAHNRYSSVTPKGATEQNATCVTNDMHQPSSAGEAQERQQQRSAKTNCSCTYSRGTCLAKTLTLNARMRRGNILRWGQRSFYIIRNEDQMNYEALQTWLKM